MVPVAIVLLVLLTAGCQGFREAMNIPLRRYPIFTTFPTHSNKRHAPENQHILPSSLQSGWKFLLSL